MGLCASSGAAAAEGMAAVTATAMVVLPTGELREYPGPATAARVLEDCVCVPGEEGGWFLSDADAMGFEGPVAAVAGGEALRAGQIYFVLPAEVQRRGLRREEVAALAVRASAALVKAGSAGGRRRRGAVAPLVFPQPEERDAVRKVVAAAPARKGSLRRQPSRFAPDLSSIPECDASE